MAESGWDILVKAVFYGIKEMFELYLQREQETTNRIEKIIKYAESINDRLSYKFLMDFVAFQREEEATAQTFYDQIVESGMADNMALLVLYDRTLKEGDSDD